MLVEYDVADGKPVNGVARGYYRLGLQLFLIGLFRPPAGRRGRRYGTESGSLLCLCGPGAVEAIFPAPAAAGFRPCPPALAVVTLLTAVIYFSVGGLTRRGLATFAGSMLGVLLTCGLAVWFTRPVPAARRRPALCRNAALLGIL